MTPRGMRGSEVRLRPARGALSCGCADGRSRVAADAGRISLRSATAATWLRSSACRFCALRRPRLSLAQPSVPSRRRARARGGSSSRRPLPDRTHPRGCAPASGWRSGLWKGPRRWRYRCRRRRPVHRPQADFTPLQAAIEKVGVSATPGRAGPEEAIRRWRCRGGGYRHRV